MASSAEEHLIERSPPHNKDAEIAVLGGMLLDSEAMSKVIDMLKSQSFYYPAHSVIFEGIRAIYEKGQPVDFISVTDYLKNNDLLQSIGGLPYILDIHNSVPTTANIEYYAKIVERSALLRRLIKAGTDIVQLGYQNEGQDISHILNSAEQKIFEIGQRRMKSDLEHVRPLLWGLFEKLEHTYNSDDVDDKSSTSGLKDLDMWLGGGMNPSDLIILAARPAMGKTSLALSIGTSVALRNKKPVAVFSLEMSKEQLITRMLCAEASMNAHALKAGTALHPDDWGTISEAISYLSEAPVYLDDSSVVTPTEMRAKVRRLKAEHNELGLVIVDYLQLMETGGSENRVQEMSKISRGLKQLAREMDVPVLALSQLSRAVEQRQSKRPMLSDLRESGSIEQDADIVMFLYRDEYYNPDSPHKNISEIIVAKHRHGPTGTVKVFFDPHYTKFADLNLDMV